MLKGQSSKGQGHQADLLTAVLARQAAAAVGVRYVLAVGNCCYVAVCSAVQGASASTGGGRRGWGHIVAAARLQLVTATTSVTEYTYNVHYFNFNLN